MSVQGGVHLCMFGFKYIKSNVKNFSGDRFCVLVCLLSIIIVGFHTWQFIGSDYNYNCFVRVAFFFSVTPGTALFGRKAAYVMLVFFFSLGVSYVNTFNNYTGSFSVEVFKEQKLKDILSVTDLDKSDFIIKWRMTEMCNADCSYCIRKNRHVAFNTEKVNEQNRRLCEVAKEISKMLETTDFCNVKIDLIGGEVSILDLEKICSNFSTKKIKKINLTTNLLKPVEYYKGLCDLLHSKGIKSTVVASFHYEYQTFDKYFEKIEILRNYFDILGCELVSNTDNQDLCKEFIEECKKLKLDYMVEGDLRAHQERARINGLIIDSSKKIKKDRYKVCFTDGTEKNYTSRNQLLMDSNNIQNVWQKAIHTRGFICSNSYNFVYIDFDTAIGRTESSNLCTNRMSIEKFKVLSPRGWESENCTLCGHMSLWRE